MKSLITILLSIVIFTLRFSDVSAVVDPRSSVNNKFCIGLLSPETELEEAAKMINNNGDWGYVVIVIKKSERNLDRWQDVFHLLSKNHLIPIVRIATDVDSLGFWQKPTPEDAQSWADFLTKLYFPTKTRYVQVYNEVNRASEWGGRVDAVEYAQELNRTINALKARSEDFFVLNAPLDLSLESTTSSMDAGVYMQTMTSAVPDIFIKLDGWASHSYPNPDFSASPFKGGRTGISGYKWELEQIKTDSEKPVFITETGWRRQSLEENQIAQYYKDAYEKVWNDKRVVAVCPFIFDYKDGLFDLFSFKNNDTNAYYKYYDEIKNLGKESGEPTRENIAEGFNVKIPKHLLVDHSLSVTLNFKNLGHFIWEIEKLVLTANNYFVDVYDIKWSREQVFPGQDVSVNFKIKTRETGNYNFQFQFRNEETVLIERNVNFTSETFMARVVRFIKSLS